MSQDSEQELSQFKNDMNKTQNLLTQLNEIDAGSDEEIAQEKKRQQEERKNSGAKGLAAASHIVSGIIVGVALGYGLDVLAGIEPWGIIILTPIGFAGGMLNMVRSLER